MNYSTTTSAHDMPVGIHEQIQHVREKDPDIYVRMQTSAAQLGSRSTQELISRIGTTSHPLALWFIHQELDARSVPPALRTPYRDESPGLIFVTWLADVYWLARRYPRHAVEYARFRHLFSYEPGSEDWHRCAVWVYRQGQYKNRYYFSKAFSLTDKMRQPLATLISHQMQADRLLLKALPKHIEALKVDAINNRDKSGKTTPEQVAGRRAEILRLYVLSGRNGEMTARWYELMGGGTLTRQVIAKQLPAIEAATGLRLSRTL